MVGWGCLRDGFAGGGCGGLPRLHGGRLDRAHSATPSLQDETVGGKADKEAVLLGKLRLRPCLLGNSERGSPWERSGRRRAPPFPPPVPFGNGGCLSERFLALLI